VNPPLVQVFGARLGDDLAFPRADDAARIEVSTAGGQELDHVGLTLRGGPHQGRLSAPAFFRIDVGAGIQQPPGRVDMAAAGHCHQRRFAFRILGIGIGTRLEQRVDDRRRTDDGEPRSAPTCRTDSSI
jgi:hypothetical protein